MGWVAVVATLILIGAGSLVVVLMGSPGGGGVDVVDAAPEAPEPTVTDEDVPEPASPAATPTARRTAGSGPASTRVVAPSRSARPSTSSARPTARPSRTLDAADGTGPITSGRTFRGLVRSSDAAGSPGCSYGVQDDPMVAAVNPGSFEDSQACGARLQVTGTGGTATVTVVGRCESCPPGGLGLSAAAFAEIGSPAQASWRLTSTDPGGPVRWMYGLGSTRLACTVQVRDIRNPVQTVRVRVGQEWRSLERQSDNFFQNVGLGCGGELSAVDIYGNTVTAEPGMLPGVVQTGDAQFSAP